MQRMKQVYKIAIPIGVILLGITLIYFGIERPITIDLDGQAFTINSRALTVRQALQDANLTLQVEDQVNPSVNSLLGWNPAIQLVRSRSVQIWGPGNGPMEPINTPDRIPANLLSKVGILLFPGDRLFWNGELVQADQSLLLAPSYLLQYVPAQPLQILSKNGEKTIYSSAPTVGGALWENGITLSTSDRLSIGLNAELTTETTVEFKPAAPITVQVGEDTYEVIASADTIGQALAQANMPLQGLDYSIPSENEPVPADRIIKIVRVEEEVVIEQESIPFETEYVADPNTELDERSIVTPGEYGIQASRIRVRYENGTEVSREKEAEWTAKEPVTQKTGYGTQVVIRTLDTPSGPVEYWRAVNVYATSYSPCRSGADRCYYGTSSGLPVQRGVIGVTIEWYYEMAGQQVYVPDYGTAVVGDVGGGIPGKYWIDLAFTDENFEPWYYDTTLYFLTPVPDTIPWILP